MSLSPEAEEFMKSKAASFFKSGGTNISSWHFPRPEDVRVLTELSKGNGPLIECKGNGKSCSFTRDGVDWVNKNLE